MNIVVMGGTEGLRDASSLEERKNRRPTPSLLRRDAPSVSGMPEGGDPQGPQNEFDDTAAVRL